MKNNDLSGIENDKTMYEEHNGYNSLIRNWLTDDEWAKSCRIEYNKNVPFLREKKDIRITEEDKINLTRFNILSNDSVKRIEFKELKDVIEQEERWANNNGIVL